MQKLSLDTDSRIYLGLAIEKVTEATKKVQVVKSASEDAITAAEEVRNFLEEIKEMSGISAQQAVHEESKKPPIHVLDGHSKRGRSSSL